MKVKRRRFGKKNKIIKRAVIMIIVPAIIVIVFFSAMFAIRGRFMPSATISMVENYKKAAELVGCTWQELVVYDTVRYENDLEDVNPYLSAVDFMKMYYEIYRYVKTDEGGNWTLVSGGNLTTTESICSWLGISSVSNINTVLDVSKKYVSPEFFILFSSKDLDDLIIEKGFSEKQIEWADKLMTSGALDEMFGEIYELPDYIESVGGGYFGWPTPELYNVTSKFAESRNHPIFGINRSHNGVDISGTDAMDSPVVSIDDGFVIQVNLNGGERGINVRVQHNIGDDVWISRYQHLSAAKVEVGQNVSRGTIIGTVGNSGIGTGPHLHLELTYNGVLVDPLPLLQ